MDRFLDQLEAHLREVMEIDPPRPASRWEQVFDRWNRWMVRPVIHAGIALVMVFVLAAALSGTPSQIIMDTTDHEATESREANWVDVVEVPDPVPPDYPSIARQRASRFVVLVEPVPPPYVPPEIGLGAV